MESAVRSRHLDRLVILSAISGTRISDIKNVVRDLKNKVKVYEFEKLLEEETKSITYEIVSRLLISRDATVRLFERIFDYIIEDAQDEALVTTHLMYLSQGPQGEGVTSFLVNPLLRSFVERARKVMVIEYLEDYYHGLLELLRRVSREPLLHMYTIDPYTYLHWRGVELNLLTVLKMMGADTYIFAMKHPKETHKRFLEYILGFDEEKVLAYISHPIRALRKGIMYKNSDVLDIEKVKSRLRKCKGLVLFEPTTIDELIYEKGRLSLKITKESRWPSVEILRDVAKDVLVDDAKPLREDYYVYPVNLVDKEFEKLYGPVLHTLYALHDMDLEDGKVGKIITRVSMFADMSLTPLIKSQIEVRDFLYVEQSKLIIAYPKGVESKGMLQELARAQAMAKTIYMIKGTSQQVFDVKGLYLGLDDLEEVMKKMGIC